MHWKLRHNRLLSRGASNLGIFALECAVDIRVGLRRGLFMKGGDRYEPRKTFLLADLQEIVRDIRGVSIVAWLHCSQGMWQTVRVVSFSIRTSLVASAI